MRTQYFRKRRWVTPRLVTSTVLLGALLLFIVGIRVFFPGLATTLLSPVLMLGDAGTHLVGNLMPHNQQALLAERDALRAERDRLMAENALLRAEGSVSPEESSGIVAGVIARPPLSPYDVLIVGKGSNDGVQAGALVFSNGIPLGTVADAGFGTSHIGLFSAPGRTVSGWVGEARIPVTVVGEGAGAFTATVARDAGILEGDTVFVPGPGALPLGTVARITTHPSSPGATLFIRPLVNLFTLSVVTIAP